MLWILFVILAYLLFALVSLVDKYLLSNVRIQPEIVTFYIGVLGLLVFLLIPFVGFSFPSIPQLFLSVGAGIVFTYSLFLFFKGLEQFETSRIVPAIGALIPILTLLLVLIFSKGNESFSLLQFLAFASLIGGTVLISLEKRKRITIASLKTAFLSAFFFAIAFVMAKFVYLAQPFWSGFMLMRLGGFFVSIWFLFASKLVRDEFFGRGQQGSGISFREMPRISFLFLISQSAGALGEILRNLAVFWVPFGMLPFIHALQGTEYIFLLFFATLLSLKFPHILKEEISKSVLWQKFLAILLIIFGIAILSLV